MMRPALRFAAIWAGCLALAGGACAALVVGTYVALDDRQRSAVQAILDAAGPLPYLTALGIVVVTGFVAGWIRRTYFDPLRRAADAVRILAGANAAHRLESAGCAEMSVLAATVNALGERFTTALHESEARIAEARQALELEKNRLAVLMSELPQSVIVCDGERRIVLYNEQARRLFTSAPAETGADSHPGYIGLGRSLYGLLERELVEGALERLAERRNRGDIDSIEVLTAPLAVGGFARIRFSSMPGATDASASDTGFVMLLEDVTQSMTGVEQHRVALSELSAQTESALAVLRPALIRIGRSLPAQATQALASAEDACARMAEALGSARAAQILLERAISRDSTVMRSSDLLEALAGALRQEGLTVNAESGQGPDAYPVRMPDLLQAVRYLGHRMRHDFDLRDVSLRLSAQGTVLVLDFGWLGHRLSGATMAAWIDDPLALGGEASALSLRDLLERQGAELGHEIDRASGRSSLRLSLSVTRDAPTAPALGQGARPIFYDFDLPALARLDAIPGDALLSELAYTAFDTETTGLDPSGGDEIIAIGAIRIVNGRMLDRETFDQLVDTRRTIHPEAIKVHGIHPTLLRGQPTLERVLPRFHTFCEGTVLLGHNVAFDLRFLQIKEQTLGVRFRQPALDTLLLGGVVHEHGTDNRLEAIAHRLGIEVVGRHTALGDARVTAEVFLKLLPLLAARGIHTLAQAQAASEKTPYARLAY